MHKPWLILADDLTGAADCASAFARRGSTATVSWGDGVNGTARPSIFAFDVNSRGLSAGDAALTHDAALKRHHDGERTLFKKIDSTLRGQPAAEIAITLDHLKVRTGAAFGVMAPAFPDNKRTTVEGCVQVDGQPLEHTELWRRDHTYATADLVEMLASAGIAARRVPISVIRSGHAALRTALSSLAELGEVVAVCDVETNEDLLHIAVASSSMPSSTVLIGSAGLALAVASLTPQVDREAPTFAASDNGALIVVGSLAAGSRMGARTLAKSGLVTHLRVTAETLLHDEDGRTALGRSAAARLVSGENILVEIGVDGEPDMSLGSELAARLAEALAPAASRMSAFAATGGETASALLSHFGVHGIQLVDEIEPGVALGVSLGALSIPVATKAGAFGDANSLLHMATRIAAIAKQGTFI
jgi:uncharacterized protein YgbK (DUF1537 family)